MPAIGLLKNCEVDETMTIMKSLNSVKQFIHAYRHSVSVSCVY